MGMSCVKKSNEFVDRCCGPIAQCSTGYTELCTPVGTVCNKRRVSEPTTASPCQVSLFFGLILQQFSPYL
jgi:hypothetical protein